ncbi:MAG: sodium:solute symporter [Kiritimatiellales bacterium]
MNSLLTQHVQGINLWDILIIAVYFLGIVLLGIKYGKSKDTQSYFLAGRSMTWPIIGISLFAASISSSTLIGQAGESYNTGLTVFNYNLISVTVMVFFAGFFLPFYIRQGIYTMPEFLERRFSAASRYYFSGVTILVNIFLDAAGSLYAAALVMKLIFPEASLILLAAIFAVLVAVYTIPGGLSAAIRVDFIQGIILLAGSIIITFAAARGGGAEYVRLLLSDPENMMLHLIRPMDDPTVPWLGLIIGIPVLGFFFWGNNQMLVQRCLTAKNVDEGRKGVLLAGALTLFTLFVIHLPGIMAQQLFPGLEKGDMVYPKLVIELLPNVLIGFLLSALIAALTSSVSGLLNAVATLFTMDFYVKIRPDRSSRHLVWAGRAVSFIVLLIAVAWVPMIARYSSLVTYYQEMLSMVAPPIVAVFLIGVFWKRANAAGAFAGLMGGMILGLIAICFKISGCGSVFGNIHFLLTVPLYFGLSAVLIITVSLLTKSPDMNAIRDSIWTLSLMKTELAEQKQYPVLKRFLFWGAVLLGLCIVELILFR